MARGIDPGGSPPNDPLETASPGRSTWPPPTGPRPAPPLPSCASPIGIRSISLDWAGARLDHDEALDLTQEYFARLLEKRVLAGRQPLQGEVPGPSKSAPTAASFWPTPRPPGDQLKRGGGVGHPLVRDRCGGCRGPGTASNRRPV